MATIPNAAPKSVFSLSAWLGLNESPDGDTGLAVGEAPLMRNFRVTTAGNLQVRPGYHPACEIPVAGRLRGLWAGSVNGSSVFLAAKGGRLWQLKPTGDFLTPFQPLDRGPLPDADTAFFAFDRKVYLLTGEGYHVWDGLPEKPVREVEGYIPLVMAASPPSGGGTLLEPVNKLTGKRRCRFSPDGVSRAFCLPEALISEVVAVDGLPDGVTWSVSRATGTVTFTQAPPKGVDSLTVVYRVGNGDRQKVERMRFAELFGGNDSRVFLYGDGSHEALYSGLTESGQPSAEYFPDLNVAAVGAANTPLNALIRHYDRLLCFKADGAWAMEYLTTTLADGSVLPAFSLRSINRDIGCDAPGQARLIDNAPWTLSRNALYAWNLSGSAVRDERNAQRVSDRVAATLAAFDAARCVTFDDAQTKEFYVCCGLRALVCQYGTGVWYYYAGLPIVCMARFRGALYFGAEDGRVMALSRKFHSDDGRPIDARWESGSMAFQRDWQRKYSTVLWLGLKPERRAALQVSVRSDRKTDFPVKTIAASLAYFEHVNFARFSFRTFTQPRMFRAKLKVKKAAFYKLILSSCSAETTATVTSADIQLRYTGNVK